MLSNLYILKKENIHLKRLYQTLKAKKRIKEQKLFDKEFYLRNYPTIKNSKIPPLMHYIYHGYKEGKIPSTKFNGNYYQGKYPDVKKSKMSPLIHYVLYGKDNGLFPTMHVAINSKENKIKILQAKIQNMEKTIKKMEKKFKITLNNETESIFDYSKNEFIDIDAKDIIICCCAKNEEDYIIEWLDYHFNLGFDKVYIFDNNDDRSLSEFLKDYKNYDKIKILKRHRVKSLQMEAYNECLENFDFKWCAFIDCDEFIQLPYHKNIKTFLDSFDVNVECVLINWMEFGTNGILKKTNSPVQERFKKPVLPVSFSQNRHVKSIIKKGTPGRFIDYPNCPNNARNYHNSLGKSISFGLFQDIDFRIAYIKHYFTKSLEEWKNKSKKTIPSTNKIDHIPNLFQDPATDKPFKSIEEILTKKDEEKYLKIIENIKIPIDKNSLTIYDSSELTFLEREDLSGDENKIIVSHEIISSKKFLLNIFKKFENKNIILKTKNLPDNELFLDMITYAYATNNCLVYNHFNENQTSKIENIEFDKEYYLNKYDDVKKTKIDPIEHYLRQGKNEGRYPNRKTHIFNKIKHKKPKLKKNFKLSIKIATPKDEFKYWGDYFFSLSLQKEFERKGVETEIHFLEEWYKPDDSDVVIVLRGITPFKTNNNKYNIMWNISHPDMVNIYEYEDYDLVFTCSDIYTEKLKDKVYVPVETLLQCSDDEIFFPEKSYKYQSDLLFIGNTRGIFRKIIKDLNLSNYNIKIYGIGWEQFIDKKYIYGKNISNSELNKYYSSSKIILNDHWEDMAEKGFISNRIFDGAASGAFIISDKVKNIEKVFGDSIITYSNKYELDSLIKYYLNNDEERKKKINDARKIVLDNHLFKHRVESILNFIQTNWTRKNDDMLDNYPLVSIIITNRNGHIHLKRLFNNFENTIGYTNYEIIVVDNGSNDNSILFLEELSKKLPLTIIKNDQNQTFSYANNQAAKKAKGEYILLLNNDIEPINPWLNEMMNVILNNENVGSVGAKLIYPYYSNKKDNEKSYKIQHGGIGFKEEGENIRAYNLYTGKIPFSFSNRTQEVPGVTAAVLLIKKSLYDEIGGLDEVYVYGYEDVDLSLKLHEKGYKNILCSTAILFHHESSTQNKDSVEEISTRRKNNFKILNKRWKTYVLKKLINNK